MIDASDFEDLVIEFIASHLELPEFYLRKIKLFTTSPENDCELFELYDTIPARQQIADNICDKPLFSKLYSQILSVQKESFISEIARRNFDNKQYWIANEWQNVPIYSNSYNEICQSLKHASSYDFKIYMTNIENIVSKFGSLISSISDDKNGSFLIDRHLVNLHFDKFAKLPIQPQGWFNQGVFLQFIQNRKPDSQAEAVLWSQLFGERGALSFFNKSIIVASGINLEIHFYGILNNGLTGLFKNKPLTASWYKTSSNYRLKTHIQFDKKGDLTLRIQSHPDDLILVAMEIDEINNVFFR